MSEKEFWDDKEIVNDNDLLEQDTDTMDTAEVSDDAPTAEHNIRATWIALSTVAVVAIAFVIVMIVLGNRNKADEDPTLGVVWETTEASQEGQTVTVDVSTGDEATQPGESTSTSTPAVLPSFIPNEESTTDPEPTLHPALGEGIRGFLDAGEYPEVSKLIKDYYACLKSGDKDAFEKLFYTDKEGISPEEKMDVIREIVEDYQDIRCFMLKGMDTDSVVVYAANYTKFINLDTCAPSLSRFYVVKKDDGYKIYYGDAQSQLTAYMDALDQKNQVLQLQEQVDTALEKAKQSDPKLAKLLNAMMS